MGLCFSFDCGDCDVCCNPCCMALSACCLIPCLCPNACGQQQQPPQTVVVHHPPVVVEQPPPPPHGYPYGPPPGAYPGYPHPEYQPQPGYPPHPGYQQPHPLYRWKVKSNLGWVVTSRVVPAAVVAFLVYAVTVVNLNVPGWCIITM